PTYRGRYAWTGREIEVEVGLQFNRARVYDPHIGRWISEDPLGFAAGDSNLYRYVLNSPNYETDPRGLWPDPPVSTGGKQGSNSTYFQASTDGSILNSALYQNAVRSDPSYISRLKGRETDYSAMNSFQKYFAAKEVSEKSDEKLNDAMMAD